MYEGLVLATLAVLVILLIQPAEKQESPLIIIKPGLYHATLAPQLGRVEQLIEQIAAQFHALADIASLQFKMCDADGQYLLAAGFRQGMLYIQAIQYKTDKDCETLRKFTDDVLVNIPFTESNQGIVAMRVAVQAAAMRLKIDCLPITYERDAC